MIIGILGASCLKYSASYRLKKQILLTKKKQEKIIYSLAAYMVTHKNALPPPSTPTDPLGENSGYLGYDVYEGIIPFKTLGLPEEAAKDGFGHYFKYVINPEFLNASSDEMQLDNTHFLDKGKGKLIVQDKEGHEKGEEPAIAFLLISYGINGIGSYYKQGNHVHYASINPSMMAALTAEEQQNILQLPLHSVLKYQERPFNPEGRERFDQIVRAVMSQELWYEYAKKPAPLFKDPIGALGNSSQGISSFNSPPREQPPISTHNSAVGPAPAEPSPSSIEAGLQNFYKIAAENRHPL
jgi:hypothetical protein